MKKKALEESLIEVELDALAQGGACIGTISSSDAALSGKKVFVPFTAPGERVIARLVKNDKRFAEAALESVQQASPSRVTPPCQYYGKCGGCNLQHLEISAQRAAKLEMVRSMLLRQAGSAAPSSVRFLDDGLPDYHYRNKITLHVDGAGRVGFYARQSKELVEIESCQIAEPAINRSLAKVRRLSGKLVGVERLVLQSYAGRVLIEARLRADCSKLSNSQLEALAQCEAEFHLADEKRRELDEFSGAHFAQINTAANLVLRDRVVSLVENQDVTDLYGGAGNFGLALAQAGRRVCLVELNTSLVELARERAREAGVTAECFETLVSDCADFARDRQLGRTVILDPPRSGAREVASCIEPRQTSQVIYVSCNLPMLCRDLKELLRKGYTLTSVELVDMFPQTDFVEIIANLAADG